MKISCSICCWLMAFLKLLLHLHFSNRTKLDKKWKELPSQRSTERLKRATTDNNQSFVLARRTWDETPVERKLRELFQRYGFTVKFLEDISRDFYKGLFFVGEIGGFPSRLGIISLTQNLFLCVGWLRLISKNQRGGPRKSKVAMLTKLPTIQQLYFGWNALGGSFSLGWMPVNRQQKVDIRY